VSDIRETAPAGTIPATREDADDAVSTDTQHIDLQQITPRPRRSIPLTVLTTLVATGGTILLLAALVFHLQGGHWFIVKTPSMGTAAPVGTLVLTTPTTASALHAGDVIAFHPPTTPDETYTHRIVKIGPTGLISTKGDINGATDPWQLTGSNVVGKAAAILPGLGWLIRGLPIVLLGIVIVFLATARVRNATRKSSYRIAGMSLAVSVAAFFLKPFTGVVIETTSVQHGSPTAIVVSTGLLPIRVTATHGTHTDLASGQLGQVHVPASAHHGFYALTTALHLSVWEWVAMIGVCCLPLLWTMIVGLPPKDEATA
jgi:signal peptidase I